MSGGFGGGGVPEWVHLIPAVMVSVFMVVLVCVTFNVSIEALAMVGASAVVVGYFWKECQ